MGWITLGSKMSKDGAAKLLVLFLLAAWPSPSRADDDAATKALRAAEASLLAAGDPAAIYRAYSSGWKFNSIFVRLHEQNREYCELAASYDSIEVDIRRTAQQRSMRGENGKEYKFTVDDARKLLDFAEMIALQKRTAERQCKR